MKHCSKCKRCGEGSNRNRRGTAAVEFAVIAPVLFMLGGLSKNSPSKFISPCHQMACGFQA